MVMLCRRNAWQTRQKHTNEAELFYLKFTLTSTVYSYEQILLTKWQILSLISQGPLLNEHDFIPTRSGKTIQKTLPLQRPLRCRARASPSRCVNRED